MEDSEAFRAPARPRGGYSTTAPGGRPLVPVAQGIRSMVAELMSSANLMPLFETNLTGEAFFVDCS